MALQWYVVFYTLTVIGDDICHSSPAIASIAHLYNWPDWSNLELSLVKRWKAATTISLPRRLQDKPRAHRVPSGHPGQC